MNTYLRLVASMMDAAIQVVRVAPKDCETVHIFPFPIGPNPESAILSCETCEESVTHTKGSDGLPTLCRIFAAEHRGCRYGLNEEDCPGCGDVWDGRRREGSPCFACQQQAMEV